MKKNKLLTIMLIILATLALIGVVVVVLITQLTKEETEEQTAEEMVSASVEVPEITTNLADDHVIRISLQIVTDSEDAKEELTKRDFQVNNIVIDQLSEMKKEDLKGNEGLENLKSTIKSEVNGLMQEGQVEKVYIKSKIIQ